MNPRLFYYDENSHSAEEVAIFNPIFLNEDALIKELSSFKNFMKEHDVMSSEEEMREEMYAFVLDAYGWTDKQLFIEWLTRKNV